MLAKKDISVKYHYSFRTLNITTDTSNILKVNSKAHLKKLMVFMRVHNVYM